MVNPHEERSMTSHEKRAVRRAARQCVRYAHWHTATIAAVSPLKRRGGEVYKHTHPLPEEPEKGTSEHDEWEAQIGVWNKGLKEAERDKRAPESVKRRGKSFPEPTGDDVLEPICPGDGVRWTTLASAALTLAAEPEFRRTCGRPQTSSEHFAS